MIPYKFNPETDEVIAQAGPVEQMLPHYFAQCHNRTVKWELTSLTPVMVNPGMVSGIISNASQPQVLLFFSFTLVVEKIAEPPLMLVK